MDDETDLLVVTTSFPGEDTTQDTSTDKEIARKYI